MTRMCMRILRWQSRELLLVRCRASIDRQLPFELRVLEGALSGVMQELGAEITELIDTAVPALDALICHVGLPPLGCSLPFNALLTDKQRSERSRSGLPALRSQPHQRRIAPASCDVYILTGSWRGGQILHAKTSGRAPVQSRTPGFAGVQAGTGNSPDSEEPPAGSAVSRQPHQTRALLILPMHISDERRVACSRSTSFLSCVKASLPVQMETCHFMQR